jgi:putative endonuclease
MKDKNMLVFIEVRYRKNNLYGGALESIDWHKQQRIIRTAEHYLMRFKLRDIWPCRFDAVIISGSLSLPSIEWLIQAFD